MNDLKNIFKRQRPSLLRSISADASRRNPLVRAITDVGSKLKSWWQEIGLNSSDSEEEVPGPPPQKRYRKSLSISGDRLASIDICNITSESQLADNEMEDEADRTEIPELNQSRKRRYSEIAVQCPIRRNHNRPGFCFKPPVPKESSAQTSKARHDVSYSWSPAKRSVITRKNSVVFLNDATLLEHETPSVAGCSLGQSKQSMGRFPTISGAGTNSGTVTKMTRPVLAKQSAIQMSPSSSSGEESPPRAPVANAGRPMQTAVYDSRITDAWRSIVDAVNEEPRTLQTKPSLNLPPAIRFGGTSSTPVNPESLWHVSSPPGSAIPLPDSDSELGSPSLHVSQLLEAHREPLRCAGSSKQSAAALVDRRGPSGPPATMALLHLKQRSRIMETNKAARQLLSSQSSTRPILPRDAEEERPEKRPHPGESSATNECKIPKLTSVKPPVRTKKQPVAEKESMSGSRQKPKSGSRSKLRSTGQALVTSAGSKPSKSPRPPKSTSATQLPSTSVRPQKSTSATQLPSTSVRPPKSTSATQLPSTSVRPPESTSATRMPPTSMCRQSTQGMTYFYNFDGPRSSMQPATTAPVNVEAPSPSDEAERPVSPVLPCSEPAKQWKCLECWIINMSLAEKCVACGAAKPSSKNTASAPTAPLVSKEDQTQWKCDACWLSNKSDVQKCVACGASNPGLKKTAPALVAPLAVENPDQNKWTCNDCWVSNKGDVNKCVACGASKPGSNKSVFNADAPPPLDDVFLAIVSEQKSKWQCSSCLTSNDSSKTRCQCCDMECEGPSKELTPKPFNFPKVSNTNFKFGIDPEQQKQSIAKKKIEEERANETFIIINAEKIDDKENKYGKTSNYVKFHNEATNKTDNSLFLLPSAAPSCAASSSEAVPAPAASQAPGPAPVLDPAPSEPCTTPAATPESTESPSSAPQFAFMSNPTTLTDNVPTTFENHNESEAAVGFNLETRTTSTRGTSGLPAFPFGASSSVAPSTAAAETQPAPAPAFSATQPPPLNTLAQNAPPAFSTSMFAATAFGPTTNKQLDSFSAQSQAFCGLPQTPNYNNIPIQNQGGFGSSVFGGNSTNQTSVFGATSQPLVFGSGAASCQPFGATSVNQTAAFGSSSMPQHATFTTFGGSSTGLPSSFGGSNTGLLPQFGGTNDIQTTFVGNNTSQPIVFSTGGGSQAAPFAAPFSLPTQQPAAPRPMFNFSGSTPVFGFGQAGAAPSGGFNFGAQQTMDPPLGGVQFSVGSLPSGVASTRRIRKAVRRTQPR